MELRSSVSYGRLKKDLRFWRTQGGSEVDFVIGDEAAVEAKATRSVGDKHLNGIRVLHWSRFLELLWKRDFAWQGPTPTS